MRRESVGLRLGKHIQVIMIRLWDLLEKVGVGRGGGGKGSRCAGEDRRREGEKGRGVTGGRRRARARGGRTVTMGGLAWTLRTPGRARMSHHRGQGEAVVGE